MTLPHNFLLLTKSREDISNEDSSVICIMLRACVCFSGDNLSLSTVPPGKNILLLACLNHPSFLSMARIYCQYLPLLWKGFSCAVSSSSLLSPYMDWKHSLHWPPSACPLMPAMEHPSFLSERTLLLFHWILLGLYKIDSSLQKFRKMD